MAKNDGISSPVSDPFPGIAGVPASTGAAGSPGASGKRAPDDGPAGEVTPSSGQWWDRPSSATHGTVQPGQLDEGVSGLDASFNATSGAGRGKAGHYDRFSWQAPDGP